MKNTIRSIVLLLSALTFAAGLSAAPSKADMSDLLKTYFAVHRGLVQDDLVAAQRAADALGKKAALTGAPAEVVAAAGALAEATDLEAARAEFQPLSLALQALIEATGAEGETVFVARCPMAFDGEGGTWLQKGKKIANPYFGTKMSSCGSVTGKVEASTASGD